MRSPSQCMSLGKDDDRCPGLTLWAPDGYPDLHADQLANARLLNRVRSYPNDGYAHSGYVRTLRPYGAMVGPHAMSGSVAICGGEFPPP
jgi:hypothetical protein